MFHAEMINDADKLNDEVSRYQDIPVVSNVTHQQALDNYYQVKMQVKRLIEEDVERLKVGEVKYEDLKYVVIYQNYVY